MAKQQVSIDDLWVAAQWLDVYEGAEDRAACARVADMLHRMAAEREERKAIRQLHKTIKDKGLHPTPEQVREAARVVRSGMRNR